MARLSILGNETRKDQDTQFGQILISLQDIQSWSSNILSKRLFYSSSPDSETSTNTNWVSISGLVKNFTINNPLCMMNLSLCLSGEGYIGIFANETLLEEKYFNHGTNSINMDYTKFITFKNGDNKLEIKWRVATGTITKRATSNTLEVVSFNS